MQVKTFKAGSVAQALEQVKRELGPDAIILSNRKVDAGDGETCVEVMAAVEREINRARAAFAEPPERLEAGDRSLQSDLQEIKSFLSFLVSSKEEYGKFQHHRGLMELYHSLLAQGLDEKFTYILLMKALGEMDEDDSPNPSLVYKAFCRKLLEKVRFAKPFQHVASPDNIFTFVGPTGVGKTTTLAKLAAYLKVKRNMSIGLISVDTYRIGAVEQLQTYADILDIPLVVAQNRKEFLRARDRLRHSDVVLVDTTGKNFLQEHQLDDLKAIFGDDKRLRHHLVLAAGARDADLRQTISNFKPFRIQSLIFTKVDETLSPAAIINPVLRFPYPISYFCTGQSVPEDIERATHRRLLSFISPPLNGTGRKEHNGSGDVIA